jgi:hypothetical protein
MARVCHPDGRKSMGNTKFTRILGKPVMSLWLVAAFGGGVAGEDVRASTGRSADLVTELRQSPPGEPADRTK